MSQHANTAGHFVDGTANSLNSVVGDEVPVGVIKWRARQQGHCGVTVQKDFFQIVVHLVSGQIGWDTADVGIDFIALGPLGQSQQTILCEVIPHHMGLVVKNKLTFVLDLPVACSVFAGYFGSRHIKQIAINHIHGCE